MHGRLGIFLIAGVMAASVPAKALEPLGIRVTLEHEEKFSKWFPKESLKAVRNRIADGILLKLSGECPYHHWNLQNNDSLTTAIEFEAADQGSIVLIIRPVIDGKPGKTVSKDWIRKDAFDRSTAEESILAAFKALLDERKVSITTQIPVSAKQRRPRWNPDSSVTIPLDAKTNADLEHAIFRLCYDWNQPPDTTLKVELDFQSDGTATYSSFATSYTAYRLMPTPDPVRRPTGKKLDDLRPNEPKFDFTGVIIQDPGAN